MTAYYIHNKAQDYVFLNGKIYPVDERVIQDFLIPDPLDPSNWKSGDLTDIPPGDYGNIIAVRDDADNALTILDNTTWGNRLDHWFMGVG